MEKKKGTKKISGRWKFLILVSGVYILAAFFNLEFTWTALEKTAATLVKIAPLLVLIFTIIIFINLYLESGKIKKHLGKESGIRGWFYAVIAGILISGPPYVLFPLLGEMKKHGMKNSLIAVFLYNRNVSIHFFPVVVYYFGFSFSMIISFYIVLFSILNGKIVGRLSDRK